jgi:uncharacterized RDD family membrane protein YckC
VLPVPPEPVPPRLELSATVVDFGRLPQHSTPPQQRVRLGNAGGGTLNPRAATQASWLELRQIGDELVVAADTTAAGEYEGVVTVDSDGGLATIRVTARVDARPQLTVEPTQVDFGRLMVGAASATQRVEVGNVGGGALVWEYNSSGDEFFTVEREPHALLVRLRPVPGRHTGRVSVRSNGGDAVIDVHAELVSPQPPPPQPPPTPPNLATWWQRARAALLDVLVVQGPGIAGIIYAIVVYGDEPQPPAIFYLSLAYVLVVDLAYFGWRQGRTGQTFGKRQIRIRLVDIHSGQPIGGLRGLGRSGLRLLLLILFAVGLIIDLLWPLWHARRQTLDDLAVRSIVIDYP